MLVIIGSKEKNERGCLFPIKGFFPRGRALSIHCAAYFSQDRNCFVF
jgi:hypothetical protein